MSRNRSLLLSANSLLYWLLFMIDKAKALKLVINEINKPDRSWPDRPAMVAVEEETIEKDFGWIFFWNSSAFLQTGDFRHALAGNAPIIVNRFDGSLHYTGTCHSLEYYIQEYQTKLMVSSASKSLCVPITENKAEAFLVAAKEAARTADIIELRLDYLHPLQVAETLARLQEQQIDKPLIFTFRPKEQGGQRIVSLDERLDFWRGLSPAITNLISLADFELDLVEYLSRSHSPIPWRKVICSWHNFDETPDNLDDIFERIAHTPAAVIKIATKANRLSDCLKLFALIERAKTLSPPRQIIALGMGLPGMATRVLSLARGALLTFGSLHRGAESASGQPTVHELRDLYRAHRLTPASTILGVVGHPVGHSRSPLIHNTALAQLGLDAAYLPFEVEDIGGFIRDFVRPSTKQMNWSLRGLSVTIPHKRAIMSHLDFIDPIAQRIGAVNTVVVAGDQLHGYNTDVVGAMKPLEELIELRGCRVAVLGAGGAARAICYGLTERGAVVTVYARDFDKAQTLAAEFNAQAATLESFDGNADAIINCTPVGMQGHDEGKSPLRPKQLRQVRLVYDLIYNPLETQLLKDARAAGCQTLGGLAMLVGQAAEQFKLWTGQAAPLELMTETLERNLTGRE